MAGDADIYYAISLSPGNVLSLATAPVFTPTLIITVVYGNSGNIHRDFGALPLNGHYVTSMIDEYYL